MNQIAHSGQISPQDLMVLGLERLAYVKPVKIDGRSMFAVHAADGTEMAVIAEREVAFAAVRQHDLEPVSVH
ncbi:MAG: DUF1150 family protein [Kiloniellaceae bacterium]